MIIKSIAPWSRGIARQGGRFCPKRRRAETCGCFFLFLLVPLIEIALFIQVGGWIGLWPTLGIVVATAVAGTVLVRSQGSQALQRLRRSFDELRDPTDTLAHGAMILFSGALLLTPGFFTDAVGFALLVPGVRKFPFAEAQATRGDPHRVGRKIRIGGPPIRWTATSLKGEYEVKDTSPRNGPSGWTRH